MLGLSPDLSTHYGGDLTWGQVSAAAYGILNITNILMHSFGRTKLSTLDKSLIFGSVVLGLDGLVSPFFNNGEPLHKKMIFNDPQNLVLTTEYVLAFGGQIYYFFKNIIPKNRK